MAYSDLLATVRLDLKYALRTLLKNPVFSLAAVFTLALGIGGNTAIFTVTNALLLKSLPYRNPDELVMLNTQRHGGNDTAGSFSLNRYELIRDRNHSFSGMAEWATDSSDLTSLPASP